MGPRYDSGDGVTVAYDDVFAVVEARLADQVQRCAAAEALARRADRAGLDDFVRNSVAQAIAATSEAREHLAAVTQRFTTVRDLLGVTETAVSAGVEALIGQVAWVAGLIGSRLAVAGAVVASGAVLPVAAHVAAMPEEHREHLLRAVAHGLGLVGESLGRVVSADGVSWLAALSDDAMLGALGIPAGLATALGDRGLGVTGVDDTARAIVGVGLIAGISGVAPARVSQRLAGGDRADASGASPTSDASSHGRPSDSAPAPAGVSDRVDRLPDAATEQIRIERYAGGTEAHFEVYIAGTDPAAPLGGANPWDMASNVALVAEQHATSTRAVELALHAAGAESGSTVVFTGHSQGAMIATALAESGAWRTAGLITIGGPAAATTVSGDYPAIVIEHADDPIVGLAGLAGETEALVLRSTAFPEGAPEPIAAHASDRYRETAAAADRSPNIAIADAIDRLPHLNGQGVVMLFRAERVAPEGPRAP